MSKIAFYGAGPKGRTLLEAIEINGTKVEFFGSVHLTKRISR